MTDAAVFDGDLDLFRPQFARIEFKRTKPFAFGQRRVTFESCFHVAATVNQNRPARNPMLCLNHRQPLPME